MLDLLHSASQELAAREIAHALIGAAAMAAHGVVRGTDDVDLLVLERSVLEPGAWERLRRTGVSVEARPGDDADPLAGVVRLSTPSETLDVVVGRSAWMKGVLQRATPTQIGAGAIPLVTVADLILLKLYAGAARDLYDVQELLALGDRQAIEAAVEHELGSLPGDARDEWHGIVRGRGHGNGP